MQEKLTKVTTALCGFGIVNPFGPTFMGYAIGGESVNKAELLFFSLNPFAQDVKVISEYPFDAHTIEFDEIFTKFEIVDDILSSLVEKKRQSAQFGTPTFLLINDESDAQKTWEHLAKISLDTIKYSSNPSDTLSNLRKFPMNVTDRVSHEIEGISGAFRGENYSADQINSVEQTKLLEIISDHEHVKQEMRGFFTAWTGSIEFQKESGVDFLDNDAMDLKEFIRIVLKLFPSLSQLLMDN